MNLVFNGSWNYGPGTFEALDGYRGWTLSLKWLSCLKIRHNFRQTTHLVRVIHSKNMSFKFFCVRARVTFLHHCVKWLSRDSSIWMLFQKTLVLILNGIKMFIFRFTLQNLYLNLGFVHSGILCNIFNVHFEKNFCSMNAVPHFAWNYLLN